MRIRYAVYIFLFMSMITAPLVFMDLRTGKSSAQENRMLANPPMLADIREHQGTFIRGF